VFEQVMKIRLKRNLIEQIDLT